ncbi:hypothetical protein THOM_2555 [Trachipleistophora hominis]|uniref:Transposable element encoded protein n=1 Tax=Trachipleistophora hominis TaxID=72359 RepID=L7JT78_TRAHO|nr:hypothetical protein THOM_2555 [Trachipleistophora hominis]
MPRRRPGKQIFIFYTDAFLCLCKEIVFVCENTVSIQFHDDEMKGSSLGFSNKALSI